MKILFKEKGDKNWQAIEEGSYSNEEEFKKQLEKDPNILPVKASKDSHLVTIGEESCLPNGYADLIITDNFGELYIVETKLNRNPEIKRKVISQIIAYASYIWQMDYKDFLQTIWELYASKKGLEDISSYLYNQFNEEFSFDDWQSRLTEKLKKGNFRLVVCVDKSNDELHSIVSFLNNKLENNLIVYLVEMPLFINKRGHQALIPSLVAQPTAVQEKSSAKQRIKISWEDLLAKMSPRGREVFINLRNYFEPSLKFFAGDSSWTARFPLSNGKFVSILMLEPEKGGYQQFERIGFDYCFSGEFQKVGDQDIFDKFKEKLKNIATYKEVKKSKVTIVSIEINNKFNDTEFTKLNRAIKEFIKDLKK